MLAKEKALERRNRNCNISIVLIFVFFYFQLVRGEQELLNS